MPMLNARPRLAWNRQPTEGDKYNPSASNTEYPILRSTNGVMLFCNMSLRMFANIGMLAAVPL